MKVNSLEIEAFRNLKGIRIQPLDTANIICGDNAQGKTNILEAIWLFTGIKSFRGNKEKDFIPNDGSFSGISLDFTAEGREQQGIIRWNENSRAVSLNGVKKENASAFAGTFCGVIFTPDHLSLVKEGPENRRSMIDLSLSQAYPKYSKGLINYQKALKQRNTLLKDIQFNSSIADLLYVWDDHIINYGGYISALRDRYIRKLADYSKEIYSGISGEKEELSIKYAPSFGEENTIGYSLDDFKNSIKAALKNSKKEDIRMGSTQVGPHRDDLSVEIDRFSARNFGSQGQQRSIILSLKLAECNILEEQRGEPPVIMLDDVMSELDKSRKRFLLNNLKGKQVFITCCDTSAFEEMKKGRIFFVNSGRVRKQEDIGISSKP